MRSARVVSSVTSRIEVGRRSEPHASAEHARETAKRHARVLACIAAGHGTGPAVASDNSRRTAGTTRPRRLRERAGVATSSTPSLPGLRLEPSLVVLWLGPEQRVPGELVAGLARERRRGLAIRVVDAD